MPRYALDLNVKSIVFVNAAREEEALTLARGLKGREIEVHGDPLIIDGPVTDRGIIGLSSMMEIGDPVLAEGAERIENKQSPGSPDRSSARRRKSCRSRRTACSSGQPAHSLALVWVSRSAVKVKVYPGSCSRCRRLPRQRLVARAPRLAIGLGTSLGGSCNAKAVMPNAELHDQIEESRGANRVIRRSRKELQKMDFAFEDRGDRRRSFARGKHCGLHLSRPPDDGSGDSGSAWSDDWWLEFQHPAADHSGPEGCRNR